MHRVFPFLDRVAEGCFPDGTGLTGAGAMGGNRLIHACHRAVVRHGLLMLLVVRLA